MSYQNLITLLPCHSLDDFPFHLEGKSADEILAAYTVLWHPSLINQARVVPTWRRNDSGDDFSWEGALVTLPQICRDDMPGYWLEELRASGARVLDCGELENLDAMLADALEHGERAQAEISAELAQDFFALGLCHLLTEVTHGADALQHSAGRGAFFKVIACRCRCGRCGRRRRGARDARPLF